MQEKWKTWTPSEKPLTPPVWDEDVIFAVRALYSGTANEGQQQLAVSWFEYVTGTGSFQDLSYRPGPGGDRDTAFAEGKRFVGLQILKMLHPATLEASEREREARSKQQRGKK